VIIGQGIRRREDVAMREWGVGSGEWARAWVRDRVSWQGQEKDRNERRTEYRVLNRAQVRTEC
jgi:hypothetical protein